MRFSLRSKRDGHNIVYSVDIHGEFATKKKSEEEIKEVLRDIIISDINAEDIKIYKEKGR